MLFNCFLNFFRDSILFTFFNSGTSFYGGFLIFSVLGFMAKNEGVEVKDVAKSGYKNTCQLLLLAMYATEPLSKKSGNVLNILKTFIVLLLSIMTFKVIFLSHATD